MFQFVCASVSVWQAERERIASAVETVIFEGIVEKHVWNSVT